METADRSKEIRAYLKAEMSRWNAIRPLPTELERLMEEQLLAGCQGMFLWLSLQIEDICPRYTQELRSDAEILDILGNLPKDLPGAFDKALSRITNGKQGSKVFKLVASAEPAMNMDELRVASNVEPGNTSWDNSTLIGTGKGLISAYGGSLLDIDEEDLRVRFIHYSVLLHLTTPPSNTKTGIFHFDLLEAEMMLGAVCVTYLSYDIFENHISKAQKTSFAQVPGVTARSVMPSEAFRKGVNLLAKHRRQRDPKVDLERLSYELHNHRWRVSDDFRLFLDYAKGQWLLPSRDIWIDDRHSILPLWRNLITSSIVLDLLPWESVAQAATWALENNHATLFQHYLHSKDQETLHAVLSAAGDAVRTGVSHIHLAGRGLGWLGPLYVVFPEYQAAILDAFIDLGCLPFDPTLMESPCTGIYGPSLVASATSHLVAGLEGKPNSLVKESYIVFLVKYLDNPDLVLEDGSRILHVAIDHGYLILAHELLSKGADPNIRSRNRAGETPLLLAARASNKGLVEILLEHGADPGIGNHLGVQPLHVARDATIIQHLLRQRADPEAAAGGHVTPLMAAAYQGRAEAVKALLENGANPNRPIGELERKQAGLLLGCRNADAPRSWATAFDLCLASLEVELKCESIVRLTQYSEDSELCYKLVSIVSHFLRGGTSLEIHSLKTLNRLIDWLSDLLSDTKESGVFFSAWGVLTEVRDVAAAAAASRKATANV